MRSLTHAALMSTRWMARRMSVEQVSALGSRIGRTLGAGTKRDARAVANLTAAMPNITAAEQAKIIRDMWDNFGRTVAETLLIDRIAADPTRVSLANPELLQDCGADGRGTVFVSSHFGNWEVMTIPLVRQGLLPICVYKPLKNSEANSFLLQRRGHLYPGGLLPASRATLLRITRQVRAGGSICVSGDHRDSSGLSVPFFGRPAPSVTLPALLAVRYGARLLAVRVDRLPNARFSVVLERIAVQDTGDFGADVLAATEAIQAKLEAWIKADPGRWRWFYKRWDDADSLQTGERVNNHPPREEGALPTPRIQAAP